MLVRNTGIGKHLARVFASKTMRMCTCSIKPIVYVNISDYIDILYGAPMVLLVMFTFNGIYRYSSCASFIKKKRVGLLS